MARDFINSKGHAVVQPRFVAELINNRFGRVLIIRDNFPHLDGGDSTMPCTIERVKLANGESVFPHLAEWGYRLAGNWKVRRDTAYAVAERV